MDKDKLSELVESEVLTEVKDSRDLTLRLEMPQEDDNGFSITSVMGTILNRMRLIVIMMMLFLVLGAGAAYAYIYFARDYTGIASAIIMFGFPGAEEGLDPHGLSLDVNVLRSPYVIGRALDSLGLRERGFSAEGVRSNLNIASVTPHDAIDRITLIRDSAVRLPERLIDLEEVFYHPTQFVVRLYRGGVLADLSEYELNELLNEIIRSYVEHFIDTYNEFSFLDVIVGHFDPSEYDYFEIVRILNATVNNMISYVDGMHNNAPYFRSPSTDMTFGDILANLRLTRTVDINRIGALVHVNNMSRNRARSANVLEYNIMRMQMELDVARANAEDALFLVTEVYEHEQWIFTTHHQLGEHLMTARATEIYDVLLRDVLRFRRQANQIETEIVFYQERLDGLRQARSPANPADVLFVEEAIPEIFASLQNWEDIINRTVEDYLTLELYRDAVRVLTPAGFQTSLSAYWVRVALIALAAVAIGGFTGVLIALYQGEIRTKKAARGIY